MPSVNSPKEAVVRCPKCRGKMRRIPRTPLVRLLSGSRHLTCNDCSNRFLQWMGLLFRQTRL